MPNDQTGKKIALVTGANRGLGLETVKQLIQKGVTVIAAARTKASADETVAKLRSEGVTAWPLQLEITSDADRKAAAKWIESEFGRLDILVNNAGVSAPKPKAIDTTGEEIQQVFATNVFGLLALTRELLPLLKKSEAGRIVNLSSILGSLTLHSDPNSPIYNFKSFAYDASKSALNALTVHLAYELKDTNIKVNSVHPGWVKTDMGGQQAPMEIPDGAKTTVEMALIGPDGPNGRFIHLGKEIPW